MMNSFLIPDRIRICPQTGDVLEPQARIRSLADLTETSASLVSPRNAYVSFQIAVRVDGMANLPFSVRADALQGERGEIAGDAFSFYAEWYHRVQGRYYPDALVPLAAEAPEERTLASITSRNAVPDQAFAVLWVDLFIPPDIRPGDYTGAIHVTAGGETETHVLRVKALETAVPDESLIIADLNSYADNISRRMDSLRGNGNRFEDGSYFQVERQFFRMAHEHRALLHYLPYEHSGKIPHAFIPELEGHGKGMRVKDWSRFDEHFGPYLDGSAFEGTKRGAIPLPYMYLPFNFHWPADYAKFGMKGYRTEFSAIMGEFYRHFTERGWLKTKFELFLNHKKRYKLFPYDGDETRFVWDEKINDIFYELARDVLEKKEGARFIFRTDSSWSYGLHYGKYAEMIKLWVVNEQIFSWFPESLGPLRAAGCEVWTYGTAQPINQPLLGTAIAPLAAVARGVDGFVYWENTKWGDNWQETPDSDGSTAMFYPGDRLFGIAGPIPSIRLKTLRGAMQAADCMERWIREQPAIRRAKIGELIGESLGIDKDAWWPGKPSFVDLPPYRWEDAMFSEAPIASLHKGQDPEAFDTLKRKLWSLLG
ncbi:glycoside hydrolase domain-containing protein [Cohnella sp. CFH 77786]|uniref:glycoside hydrolase domain-containing protein n=1 Tax=Cohnella sp. CFH 77786 TaxID=2662265 RepID=UPI001C60BA5D|nr:glycoside hydrolase domain-containing protein [Cohnella sp. CFH 77786]